MVQSSPRNCLSKSRHRSEISNRSDPSSIHRSLTSTERSTLKAFRMFRVTPGVLLCFHGTELKQRQSSLVALTDKGLLMPERFPGAYSLTEEGYAVMISTS